MSRSGIRNQSFMGKFFKPVIIGLSAGSVVCLSIMLFAALIFTLMKTFAGVLVLPIVLISIFVGTWIGAFIAAKIINSSGLIVGMVVGVIFFLIFYLLGALLSGVYFGTMTWLKFAFLFAGGCLGGFMGTRPVKKRKALIRKKK